MSKDLKRYMAWEIADCAQRFVSDPKTNPGIFVAAMDHDLVVAQKNAVIAKLREQRNECLNCLSEGEASDYGGWVDDYENELSELDDVK